MKKGDFLPCWHFWTINELDENIQNWDWQQFFSFKNNFNGITVELYSVLLKMMASGLNEFSTLSAVEANFKQKLIEQKKREKVFFIAVMESCCFLNFCDLIVDLFETI